MPFKISNGGPEKPPPQNSPCLHHRTHTTGESLGWALLQPQEPWDGEDREDSGDRVCFVSWRQPQAEEPGQDGQGWLLPGLRQPHTTVQAWRGLGATMTPTGCIAPPQAMLWKGSQLTQ